MLKFYITLAFISVFTLHGTSQQDSEIEVNSKISEVKVFLSGAEETRTAQVDVKTGGNTIVFKDITPFLNENSIQVEGNDAYTITGVSYRNNYLVPDTETKEQEKLRNELDALTYEIREKDAIIHVCQKEIDLLKANQNVAGASSGLFFEDILDLSDLIKRRMPELNDMIVKNELEKKKLQAREKDLQKQLREISEGMKRYSGEIVVKLETNRNARVPVSIKYLTTAAGWYPLYDARSNDIKNPVQFTYKAMVYQSSGHNWENVKLTLSTSDPQISHTVPQLTTWHIRPQDPVSYRNKSKKAYDRQVQSQIYNEQMATQQVDADNYFRNRTLQEDNLRSMSDYTTLQNSGVNTEFLIEIPYSIPSNGKSYMVEVQQYEMPVTYRYFVAPKYDQDAFLLARMTGWEKYSLLSGNANIYYQGTYVGESFVDAQTTSDTMSISLGRDQDIIVKRERIKEYCKSSTVGSNKKESIGIEIVIRNAKNVPVNIEVADQVPVSRQKEIQVSIEELSGAQHNAETGKLTWLLNIEPGQTKKLRVLYEVKFPKDKRLSNL